MAATKLEVILRELGIDLDDTMLKVLALLQKKKDVSEEDVAKKLKLKVNQTRKFLYRLYEKRLATYLKKADPKKKWWYLYFWSLDRSRIRELFLTYKRKQLDRKRQDLEAEQRYAFECKSCKIKYLYEEALETEFTCPACGAILVEARTTATAKKLAQEIELMEKDLVKEEAAKTK